MKPTSLPPAAAALALALSACGGSSPTSVEQPPITPPALTCSAAGLAASDASALQTVCILTSSGELVVELDAARAPLTVENFLHYVATSYYTQTVVHRVERTPLQIFQAGAIGIDSTYFMFLKVPTRPAIALESDNGLSNVRGTIAMARAADPASAQAQFFVNVQDNLELDYRASVGTPNGYAVFGRVIHGLDTVDRIGAAPTIVNSSAYPELPNPAVLIYWATQLK